MNFIILGLIFLLFINKIILFISLFPIRVFMNMKRKSDNSIKSKKLASVQNSLLIKKNLKTRFKNILSRHIEGYIRFSLFQVAIIPSHLIRNFLYKYVYLIQMGNKTILYYGSEIRAPYKLIIGNGSIIGDKSILDARNGIVIGENVNFSSNVSIWTEQHDHRDPYFECNSDETFRVKIGDRAWIGPNVTILPSVEIGEGAVVAAGSVVTKNVEPFTIVAGLPAKKIGDRNRDLKYIFDGSPSLFY
jgi:acetyltransferase-like isoleucine patch superfamily enzyme